MDKGIVISTIIMFSTKIFSGTTLNLSHRISTRMKSDATTSTKDLYRIIDKLYKLLAWIGLLLFISVLITHKTKVFFGFSAILIMGYIYKYIYVTRNSQEAYKTNGTYAEHPFSIVMDISVNLGILLQSILIMMQN